MIGRAVFVATSLIATVAWADPQAAGPRTASLSWIRMPGAESCVATQQLAHDVEARLGRHVLVSAAEAQVSVEGRIEPRRPGGWHAAIVLRDAHGVTLGTRDLDRPTGPCDTMREPLALVIAVMLDPDAALGPRGGEPVVPAASPPPPPPPIVIEKTVPVIVEVPAPPPKPRPEWRFDGGVSAQGGLGLQPGPGLGIYAGGLLEPPGAFPLQAFGTAWLDQNVSKQGTSGDFSLVVVGGGLCPLHLTTRVVRLYGCGDGQIGLLTARIAGLSDNREPFLAVALEGRLSVRIVGPFALRGGASFVVPLLRHDFEATTSTTTVDVFKTSVVAGTVDLGLGVLFP